MNLNEVYKEELHEGFSTDNTMNAHVIVLGLRVCVCGAIFPVKPHLSHSLLHLSCEVSLSRISTAVRHLVTAIEGCKFLWNRKRNFQSEILISM